MTAIQPCRVCGTETRQKRECPACGAKVLYVPKPPKPKPPLESEVKSAIRAALVKRGAMVMIHNVDNRNWISTGLGEGVADIIAIVPPRGRFLAIEVKRIKGLEASSVQQKWLNMVRVVGGVSGVAYDVESALALLAEAEQLSLSAVSGEESPR